MIAGLFHRHLGTFNTKVENGLNRRFFGPIKNFKVFI